VGKAVGVHGLRGAVRVRFSGDGPEHLLALREVFLAVDPEAAPPLRRYRVLHCAPGRRDECRLVLEGVSDRKAALALRGFYLLADVHELPELVRGEYYHFQLVGCRVLDEEGSSIGVVREVWEAPAQDLLLVEDETGKRYLLPAVREMLKGVDLQRQEIVFSVIPGLLEPIRT